MQKDHPAPLDAHSPAHDAAAPDPGSAPMSSPVPKHVFTLGEHIPRWLGPLRNPLRRGLDRALGLNGLNAVYHSIPHYLDPHSFARCTLDTVGVDTHMDPQSYSRIPRQGAGILVANHPHGALDGVAIIELLTRHRPDVRVMANHLLGAFAELRDTFIGVDPFGGREAARFNIRAVRAALSWLKQGGLLMMFPGGEVSSFDWRARRIKDPAWDSGIGWLVEKSGAPVVPAYISGRNSTLFQAAGLLHPRARTALLVREMLNHRGTVIEVSCAPPIAAETLSLLGARSAIAPYLQANSELLGVRQRYRKPLRLGRVDAGQAFTQAVAPPVEVARLVQDVARLPPDQCLVSAGELEVWFAHADAIPAVLMEIGRLRELSFRLVGEGTGRSVDLDAYDDHYVHLFIWDRANQSVVGGYRLGHSDQILDSHGSRGLYVHSLFRLSGALKSDLRSSLEVGRSFVRPEHQRSYGPLMLLWKGIGHYVARHPSYRVLLGPVSISNDYHPVSQQLMVRFLKDNSMEQERASQVKPRNPYRARRAAGGRIDLNVSDLRIIANLLATVEDDKVGVPVLLRQYLKLNGRILGFNVDPDFNNAIDCLLWVDLTRTDPSLLQKYMGREGAQRFLAHHLGHAPPA
jgi:putative hemolysin